jgi:DNA-directed RNA polymerase subunit H (RpoH/RPB5)
MTDNSGSYSVTLAKSRRFILEALSKRGFDVSSYAGFSVNAIHKMWRAGELDMTLTRPESDEKVVVRYHDSKSLRANNIADYVEDYFTYETVLRKGDGLIIISKDMPNESVKKAIRAAWHQSQAFITAIPIELLQFSVLDHTLVPVHSVLTEEDASKVKEQFNITRDAQLPTISRFDSVAQLIGLRPGQLCRIDRPSKTAVKTEFYRICSA